MPTTLHCALKARDILCKQRPGGKECPVSGVTSYGSLGKGCQKARLGVVSAMRVWVQSGIHSVSRFWNKPLNLVSCLNSDLACFFAWTLGSLQSSQTEQCSFLLETEGLIVLNILGDGTCCTISFVWKGLISVRSFFDRFKFERHKILWNPVWTWCFKGVSF